jgi:hypothetical protein
MSVQWASSISSATPGKLGRTYNLLARNTTLETQRQVVLLLGEAIVGRRSAASRGVMAAAASRPTLLRARSARSHHDGDAPVVARSYFIRVSKSART